MYSFEIEVSELGVVAEQPGIPGVGELFRL